jgi:hypothetical protein
MASLIANTSNTDIEDQGHNLPTKKMRNQQTIKPETAKQIIADMIALNLQDRDAVDKMMHTLRRKYKIMLSNSQLLSMYRAECNNNFDLSFYKSRSK